MSQRYDFEGNKKMTKTISITSGKGGVGKTTLVCNIASQYAKEGKKVLILDGDLGMANVDIFFGRKNVKNILSVMNGDESLESALVEIQNNIYLISGGSGLKELQKMNDVQRQVLLDQVNQLPIHFDYFIIDTAPGIDDNVLYLNSAVHERNIVITPDPASLTDSYALIKVLHKTCKLNRFSIIANFVRDDHEGLQLYKKLSDVCDQFLNVSLDFKGSVPLDLSLRRATKSQQLVVNSAPHSPSSLGIKKIAKSINNFNDIDVSYGGISFFWNHILGVA